MKVNELILGMLMVSGCVSIQPTQLLTKTVTLPATHTATPVWFPPTQTAFPLASVVPSPTEDLRPGQGEIIFEDYFEQDGYWSVVSGYSGNATAINGKLTLALSEANNFLFTTRQEPILNNFYLTITASPSLCKGADEYGLLIRVSSALEYYRFSLSCDGRARVDRFYNGLVTTVAAWTPNGVIPTTVPSEVQLGVWALDEELRFFVNNQFLFGVQDKLLYAGAIGTFVRTAGETPVTVNFSDLVVRRLSGLSN